MLGPDDTPTIKFAIERRLNKEAGVDVVDIKMGIGADCIAVGIVAELGKTIITRSRFDLPLQFEHSHLINEIDEVAEQYKAARKEFFGKGGGFLIQPEKQLAGSGLRGRWLRYG